MKDKTLFEGIKCLTRRYTIFALLVLALLINVLFYLTEYFLQQNGYEMNIWYHQLVLVAVTTIVMTGVISIFLINLDGIRDEMVENLQKLIAIIRNQAPQDFAKKIEIEEVSCDDEVFEIVEVLNSRSEQIQQYINHLKYVIGYIQHEFNTPLATLSLGIERLHKQHPDIDISGLEEEIHDLSKIMNSLSYLSSQERDNVILEDISLVHVLDKVIIGLQHTFAGSEIQYDGDLTMQVKSNEIYLHIILKNLIENALKYSGDEKKVDIQLDADAAKIEIRDYGIGMTTEELKKIGLPFWQADASRGQDQGFGLGLTLVYELAEILGIHMHVASKKDVGTNFILQFISSHDA